jgi:hypothetical protein
MIGVFYSNSLLSSPRELAPLDMYLSAQIDSIANESLKRRLRQWSFQEGFSKRRFLPLGTGEFSEIIRLWKHGA